MIEINLLPWRDGLYKRQLQFISWLYAMSVLIAILGLLSTHFIIDYQTNKMQREFYLLKNKFKNSVASSEENKGKRKVTYEMLDALFHMHTSGLHIIEIAQENDVMIILGEAISDDVVSEFMSDVVSTRLIHAVKLISSRHEQDQVQFQVQVLE